MSLHRLLARCAEAGLTDAERETFSAVVDETGAVIERGDDAP